MKKLWYVISILVVLLLIVSYYNKIVEIKTMEVTSTGIHEGIIEEKYGKRGSQFNENGIPSYSLPFKIINPPKGTVSFAIVLEDKDAYPVTKGFIWNHWIAANITRTEILENESLSATDFVQGVNSWASEIGGNQSLELSSFYGGMTPPDKPHSYELHVYALDTILNLKNGFYLNELYREMEGHILEESILNGKYSN